MKRIIEVQSPGDLCLMVCQEHRSNTLKAKNCDGLDCEVCQLTKQAEITWTEAREAGIKEVVEWLTEKQNIPIRYAQNATCYDCLESLKRFTSQG